MTLQLNYGIMILENARKHMLAIHGKLQAYKSIMKTN
jgi:hypothetical protein